MCRQKIKALFEWIKKNMILINFGLIFLFSFLLYFLKFPILIKTEIIFSIFTLTSFIFSIILASTIFLFKDYDEYLNRWVDRYNLEKINKKKKKMAELILYLKNMNANLRERTNLLKIIIINLIITIFFSFYLITTYIFPLSFRLFEIINIPFDFYNPFDFYTIFTIFFKYLTVISFLSGIINIFILIFHLISELIALKNDTELKMPKWIANDELE